MALEKAPMKVDDIKRLVEVFQESGIDELEVSWGEGQTIRMTRRLGGSEQNGTYLPQMMAPPVPAMQMAPSLPSYPTLPAQETTSAPAAAPAEDAGLAEIRSPMVGTFYRAPSPESPPYVEVGARVEKGQVVCIVEAMKLMNEIEAEVSGTIVRAVADNAQPVEFNQPLFLVRPD